MEVDDLFAEYRFRCELLGLPLDRDELLAEHPEHAAELAALFDTSPHRRAESTPKARGSMPLRGEAPEFASRFARTFEDRYEVCEEIARGGMGSVVRVVDHNLRRELAMKRVLSQPGSSSASQTLVDEDLQTRFLQEGRITGRLEHPGVVPIHDLGYDATGRPYFTMKLVRGMTFAEVVRRHWDGDRTWTLIRCLEVLRKVCDTVAFAHAGQVIHRDLKPSNVMVGEFGEVHVMDWGLAKWLGPETHLETPDEVEDEFLRETSDPGPGLTRSGTIIGTPSYMAPEQAMGRTDLQGPASDVYSLGAILYELLTGHGPYLERRETGTPLEILSRVQSNPPAPIDPRRRDISALLRSICEKAMCREASERYPTASEMEADLLAYLEDRVVRAHATGWFAQLKTWVRRHRVVALTALVACLVAGASLLGFVLSAQRANAVAVGEEHAARVEARRAREQADLVEARHRDLLDLALEDRVDALRQEADHELWPPFPDRIPAMLAWIEKTGSLEPDLDRLRNDLQALARREPGDAVPNVPPNDSRLRLLHALEAHRAAHAASEVTSIDGETIDPGELDAHLERLDSDIDRLRAEVLSPPPLERSGDPTLSPMQHVWRVEQLTRLVAMLEALLEGPHATRDPALDFDEGRDWSSRTGIFGTTLQEVRNRLALTERVRELVSAPDLASTWDPISEDFMSSGAAGFTFPIPGMVPLGKNERTGLWEFWHVPSGERPEPASGASANGTNRWTIGPETGMVFVLIEGGRARCGAVPDPSSDPAARPTVIEGPVHEVFLDSFLISKYEMTRGQWTLLTGHDPSVLHAESQHTELIWPVENLRRKEAQDLMIRLGLSLPSEAQWEYACRAGTSTPWWTGEDPRDVQFAGNLRDRSFKLNQGMPSEPWNDGYPELAPVGSFRANPFGLHDVIGNVAEWCLDEFGPYQRTPRAGDGLRLWPGEVRVLCRGGSFGATANGARSSSRAPLAPNVNTSFAIGFRPVMNLVE